MFASHHLTHVPADSQQRDDTEHTQNNLVEERHAIGHAVVFNKTKIEPIGHANRFAKRKMGLHFDFNQLVDH